MRQVDEGLVKPMQSSLDCSGVVGVLQKIVLVVLIIDQQGNRVLGTHVWSFGVVGSRWLLLVGCCWSLWLSVVDIGWCSYCWLKVGIFLVLLLKVVFVVFVHVC